ncbi:uncharacterized protein LOC126188330 [Schistocerca cancellata]|uniref:uncharacterized protein LOC126188330 n=1 Tax=Schistocerca cancellata TaxID=274614 RepID=UPI002118BC67|nr:uncharacterized protein LOC126188330 [Schistocerca cancellata]
MHLNVQSIKNKIDEIDMFLSSNPCHVFCVNEHWLSPAEIALYTPEGFELVSSYCRTKSSHGGVAIFIKRNSNIEYVAQKVDHFCKEQLFEIAALLLPKLKLVIISIYRTPSSDIHQFIDQMETLNKDLLVKYRHHKIAYIGDINIDIRLKTPTVTHFQNMLRSNNLYCMNNKPTRLDACLDNIISNLTKDECQYGVINPVLSDHDSLWLMINCENYPTQQPEHIKRIRLLYPDNITKLRQKLSEVEWDRVYNCNSNGNAFNLFMNILTSLVQNCCPQIIKKMKTDGAPNRKKKHNWFTPELHDLRNTLIALHKMAKTGNLESKQRYKEARKNYRTEIQMAKQRANDAFIENSSNKCKAAWQNADYQTKMEEQDENNSIVEVGDEESIIISDVYAVEVNIGTYNEMKEDDDWNLSTDDDDDDIRRDVLFGMIQLLFVILSDPLSPQSPTHTCFRPDLTAYSNDSL